MRLSCLTGSERDRHGDTTAQPRGVNATIKQCTDKSGPRRTFKLMGQRRVPSRGDD